MKSQFTIYLIVFFTCLSIWHLSLVFSYRIPHTACWAFCAFLPIIITGKCPRVELGVVFNLLEIQRRDLIQILVSTLRPIFQTLTVLQGLRPVVGTISFLSINFLISSVVSSWAGSSGEAERNICQICDFFLRKLVWRRNILHLWGCP